MVEDLFNRFSSRKFLVSLFGQISGLMIVFGGKGFANSDIETMAIVISGAVLFLGSILGYLKAEKDVDVERARNEANPYPVPPSIPSHEEITPDRMRIEMALYMKEHGLSVTIINALLKEPADFVLIKKALLEAGAPVAEVEAKMKEWLYV